MHLLPLAKRGIIHRLLLLHTLFLLSMQANAQLPSFQTPVRRDIRIDATIRNKMSTDDFMFKLLEIRKHRAEESKNQVIEDALRAEDLYDSFGKYPIALSDGWHKATATDGATFVSEYTIYVEQNKPTKAYFKDLYKQEIVFASQIKEGKSFIKFSDENMISSLSTVYFFENIIEPQTMSSKPRVGYITFWTDFPNLKKPISVLIRVAICC